MDLHIDEEQLNICVQCGLCLPHCPTYRATGDETRSPRGRIRLMREVQDLQAPLTDEIVDAIETCVQCRGCEPACPSGVPYGRLIEHAKETVAERRPVRTRMLKLAFAPLSRPRLLRAGSSLLAIASKLRLVPKRLGLPTELPVRRRTHRSSGSDVQLFTGCVMDAWQRDVHQATQRVIETAGFGVEPTGDIAPCCGALHAHAGLASDARRRAEQTIAALAGDDRPILIDSAGCGAAMKEYGQLLGTAEAVDFSRRVYDVQEWLAGHLDRLPAVEPLPLVVAVQDPCHIRHVQKVHTTTRATLGPFVSRLVDLADDGLCCGAGGAYSMLQPELAGRMRARKIEAIDQVDPDIVASANPGCSMHLAAGGVPTVHPMQLIDQAIRTSGAD